MYIITFDDERIEVADLNEAMNVAKLINRFVTITGKDFELVGMFGVDSIVNGICPDGVEYSWMKRRSQ